MSKTSSISLLLCLTVILGLNQVNAAGQCWYCSQVLHNQVCAVSTMGDGVCAWVNGRCVPAPTQPKLPLLSLISVFASLPKQSCFSRPYNACIGIDKDNSQASCAQNTDQYTCVPVTHTSSCTIYPTQWRCQASAATQGCVWYNSKCQADSCAIWPQNLCSYKLGTNYQKYGCVWSGNKCVDASAAQMSVNICVAMSLLTSFPYQISLQGKCLDCVGSYPVQMRSVFPLSRRRILTGGNN